MATVGERAKLYKDTARIFGMKMKGGSVVAASLRPVVKLLMGGAGGGFVLARVKRFAHRAPPLRGVSELSETYSGWAGSNFGAGMIGAVDWANWAGGDGGGGGGGYQFGDISRGLVRKMSNAGSKPKARVMCTLSQPKVSGWNKGNRGAWLEFSVDDDANGSSHKSDYATR